MDYKAYLARFNASTLIDPTVDNLFELQHLHMKQVPFENLDVGRRVPIYLNVETIYEKIVNQKRGGYCYEVNGLFHWLLGTLGYQAQLVAATVKRPNGVWAKSDTHVGIIAEINQQQYLVDVGFGVSPLLPIHLNEKEHTDIGGTYKVIQRDNNYFDLTKKEESGWRTLYRFDRNEKRLVDFHEGCVFNQVSKNSTFTQSDLVILPTVNGRLILSDDSLTEITNGVSKKRVLTGPEKKHVLKELFGIELS